MIRMIFDQAPYLFHRKSFHLSIPQAARVRGWITYINLIYMIQSLLWKWIHHNCDHKFTNPKYGKRDYCKYCRAYRVRRKHVPGEKRRRYVTHPCKYHKYLLSLNIDHYYHIAWKTVNTSYRCVHCDQKTIYMGIDIDMVPL